MDLRERINTDLRLLARKLVAAPSGATSEDSPSRPSDDSDPLPPPSKARGRATALPLAPLPLHLTRRVLTGVRGFHVGDAEPMERGRDARAP
jgi:hypothetical protein